MSDLHPFIVNIEFKIPARTQKEAEHFARLAEDALARRKSITHVQKAHVWRDDDFDADMPWTRDYLSVRMPDSDEDLAFDMRRLQAT